MTPRGWWLRRRGLVRLRDVDVALTSHLGYLDAGCSLAAEGLPERPDIIRLAILTDVMDESWYGGPDAPLEADGLRLVPLTDDQRSRFEAAAERGLAARREHRP